MLVELAIGDAYGGGFEYCTPEFVAQHHTVRGYVRHPRHLGKRPGAYTDDTQMTLAVAELLLSGKDWSPRNLAEKFVEVFHRDQRAGYSTRTRSILQASSTGTDLLARITPGKDSSGAAMRVTPVGLLPGIEEVLRLAEVQARVTHDSAGGVESAQAAALAVHYCYHRLGPTRAVATWVEQSLRGRGGQLPWAQPWEGEVGADGEMSVRAALTALSTSTNLRDLLDASIAYTGDVDTVATIALGAGSCATDVERNLPPELYETLENGPYGRDYLADLDQQLLLRYPRNTQNAD